MGQLPRGSQAQGVPAEETVLLVGVTRGQRGEARLARGLEEHLRLTGETLAASSRLTPAERLCSDGECLEQLARREHAGLAVTVSLRDSGPQSYFVTLALFDVQRRLPVQTESVCDACGPDELLTKLNDLSDKTFRLYRARLQQGAGVRSVGESSARVLDAASGPLPAAAPPAGRAPLPTRRKIIAGVLGAAALGILIPSIFWSVKDGQPALPPCADDPLAVQDCRYDNKALYGVGYALTAALTGGMLLTLFVPVQAATPQAAPQAEKVQ
ncbi:MAG TPA: hypothetical protein PLW65_10860 [Pseudomonadota bacterium]|nr:hypothetical protein [Pseudomonadota bacterium]